MNPSPAAASARRRTMLRSQRFRSRECPCRVAQPSHDPYDLPGPAPLLTNGLRWLAWLTFNAFALYTVVALYVQGQMAFALLGLVVTGIASYLFINRRMYAQRYIFPSVAGMLVFVIFPLLYTVGIGFTNYSGSNLLSLAGWSSTT